MSVIERPAVTYMLPTTAWASLLGIIARDAPPGAVIEVHTSEMQRVTEQTLQRLDRQDVHVRLTPQTPSR